MAHCHWHYVKRGRAGRRSSAVNFMTNDAADSRAANGSDRAATGEDSPANRTDSGANGSVLVLSRHAGTSAEA